jgi:hypothetical protein
LAEPHHAARSDHDISSTASALTGVLSGAVFFDEILGPSMLWREAPGFCPKVPNV